MDVQVGSPTKQDFGEVYAKWRKLTLVAKSIQRFRSLRVERIQSEGNLRRTLLDTQLQKRSSLDNDGIMIITPTHIHNDALDSFRDQHVFFEALESASKKDLPLIKKILQKDPKANLYDADSPYRLANKPNHRGYTPLYVACKNGNLDLVRLLIEHQANPYQLINVGPNMKESILLVAARWGHIELMKYLTGSNFMWSEKELRRAYKEAMGSHAKKHMKLHIQKNSKSFFGRFFSCSNKSSVYRT
jgi:hypothetical protein